MVIIFHDVIRLCSERLTSEFLDYVEAAGRNEPVDVSEGMLDLSFVRYDQLTSVLELWEILDPLLSGFMWGEARYLLNKFTNFGQVNIHKEIAFEIVWEEHTQH